MAFVDLRAAHSGRLLVASPLMGDPNFARSVIYLADHSPAGTLGVVLTRPTTVRLPDVLERWSPSLAAPDTLFSGGPVTPDGVLALGQSTTGEVVIVDLDDDQPTSFHRVRIFHGYAGWGAGQLNSELDESAWLVVDCTADDVFDGTPATLWRRVLARQDGEVSWLASYPDDVNAN